MPQLDYPSFRAAGYPIGSGIVEVANKVVVEHHLKGSGMHWAPQHVDPLLALRTIVCAVRWAEAWPQISARFRLDVEARRRQLRTERATGRAAPFPEATSPLLTPTAPSLPPTPACLPLPKTILNGRPAEARPWNRRFIPHRSTSPADN